MSSADMYESGPNYPVNLEHMRWGRFSTVPAGATESDPAEVLYVQTSISLGDPEHATLVEQLAPIREAIEPELLGFENLIQRDLDDARVANALIPYLLDQGGGTVRMFPSILVLLIPTHRERIEKFYLPRQDLPPVSSGPHELVSTAYGDGDREWAFEFSRRRTKVGTYLPYGSTLRVNPQRCKFAIIDGQHRAMALLALWRNLNKWPDSGKPFRDFYSNHSREKLLKIDQRGLSLPVTICFFPELHSSNAVAVSRDLSVVKAARKLFLDVNRSAKPPSKARQVLLDDTRISSDFVRAIMTAIKDREPSKPGLRLWNLYYDQVEDNESALPKVSVTSVLHIQYMVRMLLLGARPHKGERLVTRVDFNVYNPSVQDNNRTLVEMLGWEQSFGDQAATWKDETVPLESRPAAIKSFMQRWGAVIRNFLDHFPVYEAFATASAESRANLQLSVATEDPLVLRMIFEGQGIRSVHEAIRAEMESEGGNGYPYPDESKTVFKKQSKRLEAVEEMAMARAAELYWGQGKPWPTWMSEEDRQVLVKTFVHSLSSRVFKTKAFQVGVIMTIGHVERKLPEERRSLFWTADVPDLLVRLMSAYFRPSGFPGNSLGVERSKTWVAETLNEGRISGLVERGLYRHVRDVEGGDLKDGRWQLMKYCAMEIMLSGAKEVAESRDVWLEGARQTFPTAHVDSLLMDVERICRDAVWQYRDLLLVDHLESLRLKHRRDTGHEATDTEIQAFWTDVCGQLARKLAFSMNISKEEVLKLETRPRKGAEDFAADSAPGQAEEASTH